MNELLLFFPWEQRKKREAGETFVEEVIFELTGEILPNLTETGGEQAVVGCLRHGGFTCIPVRDQKMEVLAFQIRNFNFYLRDRRKPLTVHMEQVYQFRSLQLSRYWFPRGGKINN